MDEGSTFVGAVEAGGTKFVLALARQSDGAILEKVRIDTREPAVTFAELAGWFQAQESVYGRIAAFGIGTFGPVDIDPASARYGTIGPTPKAGWDGARYYDALAEFEVPIAIDTDVNAAALGEWSAWGGNGTLVYSTVGTGVGTGVVKHGAALTGCSHYEAGHIRVPHDRKNDPFGGICPFHGDCIEGLASGPAIIARWGHDLSHATPDQIELVAGYFADFAATLVLVHMPDRMVFGGGAFKAPGLLDALRRLLPERLGGYVPAWSADLKQRLVAPRLGDDAGIIGAVAIAQAAAKPGRLSAHP